MTKWACSGSFISKQSLNQWVAQTELNCAKKTAMTMTKYSRNDDEDLDSDDDKISQGRWRRTTGTLMEYHRDDIRVLHGRWHSTAGTIREHQRDKVLQRPWPNPQNCLILNTLANIMSPTLYHQLNCRSRIRPSNLKGPQHFHKQGQTEHF